MLQKYTAPLHPPCSSTIIIALDMRQVFVGTLRVSAAAAIDIAAAEQRDGEHSESQSGMCSGGGGGVAIFLKTNFKQQKRRVLIIKVTFESNMTKSSTNFQTMACNRPE